MFFDYNFIISRPEHVDMLSFLYYILNFDFSDLDYEMYTCFLHSMLHFTFALKKDFIWSFTTDSSVYFFHAV